MGDFVRQFVTYARRAVQAVAIVVAAAQLSACEPLSLAALGVGGSAALNHKMNGTPTRTFTASLAKVRTASLGALRRMGITTDGTKKIENGEVITARAGNREIEVELEFLTSNTTRMRVVARNGSVFYDSATATEIIVQTEKSLGV
jgi:uncharacterized protein GlcG (DUF336 family)